MIKQIQQIWTSQSTFLVDISDKAIAMSQCSCCFGHVYLYANISAQPLAQPQIYTLSAIKSVE